MSEEGLPERSKFAESVYFVQKEPSSIVTVDAAMLWLATACEESDDQVALLDILSDVQVTETVVKRRKGLGWSVSADGRLGGEAFHNVDSPYFELRPYRTFPEAVGHQFDLRYHVQLSLNKEGGGRDDVRVTFTAAHVDAWKPAAAAAVGGYVEHLLADVDLNQENPTVVW